MSEIAAKQNSWIGSVIDGFVIEDKIGEGPFARVYVGRRQDSGAKKVFKVAQREPDVRSAGILAAKTGKSNYDSQAIMFVTGGVMDAEPNTAELLKAQAARLEEMRHPDIVSVDQFTAGEESFYSMEYLAGRTLREVMDEGPVPVSVLAMLLDALTNLERDKKLPHGDLKPENIMVTSNGIKLIDPGYIGILDTKYGPQEVRMTTPAYYPLLKFDDCFAVGIMLWEIATGAHPLSQGSPPLPTENDVGPALYDFYRQGARVGQHYLRPLLSLKAPECDADTMHRNLEKFLLDAMGLIVRPDGQLDKVDCFKTFSEMSARFKAAIKEVGVEFLSSPEDDHSTAIMNWGAMKQMRMPKDWTEVEGFLMSDGRSLRKFVAPENPDVRICLYLRPSPIPLCSAREFVRVLTESAHKLTDEEIESLQDVIEGAHNTNQFQMDGAATGKANGKTVITLTGYWTKENLKTVTIFTNADAAASIVQNFYYSAPPHLFDEFAPVFSRVFESIQWR